MSNQDDDELYSLLSKQSRFDIGIKLDENDWQNILKCIANGADVNMKNKVGDTAISLAENCNKLEIVEYLLQNPKLSAENVNKVLMAVTIVGNDKLFDKILLVRKDVNINYKDPIISILMSASEDGYIVIVKKLLKQLGIKINDYDYYKKKTALSLAVQNGHKEVIDELLLHYANPGMRCKIDGKIIIINDFAKEKGMNDLFEDQEYIIKAREIKDQEYQQGIDKIKIVFGDISVNFKEPDTETTNKQEIKEEKPKEKKRSHSQKVLGSPKTTDSYKNNKRNSLGIY